jgi:PEP-CTERM motif
MSQTFTDMPGATYQVSFTLFFRGVLVAGAFFDASVGGAGLQIGPFPAIGSVVQNPFILDHVIEQFYFTGTGSDTLAFVGANSDSTSSASDVSVTAVPEPATWLMMLLGFAGVGFLPHTDGLIFSRGS